MTVDDTTIPAPKPADTRELCALALYRERGAEIVRTGPDTYEVHSCTGRGSYAVDFEAETCDCPDSRRHPELNCKHLLAVAVKRAKRRGDSARRLVALEDRLAHEDLPAGERCELRAEVLGLRRKLGL